MGIKERILNFSYFSLCWIRTVIAYIIVTIICTFLPEEPARVPVHTQEHRTNQQNRILPLSSNVYMIKFSPRVFNFFILGLVYTFFKYLY